MNVFSIKGERNEPENPFAKEINKTVDGLYTEDGYQNHL